jgi:hypothetical protein
VTTLRCFPGAVWLQSGPQDPFGRFRHTGRIMRDPPRPGSYRRQPGAAVLHHQPRAADRDPKRETSRLGTLYRFRPGCRHRIATTLGCGERSPSAGGQSSRAAPLACLRQSAGPRPGSILGNSLSGWNGPTWHGRLAHAASALAPMPRNKPPWATLCRCHPSHPWL